MRSFRYAAFACTLTCFAACTGSATQVEEANKELVRTFTATVNAGDWPALDALMTEDFVRHSQASPGPAVRSRTDFVGLQKSFLASFPDQRVTLDLLVAEGDKVAAVGRYSGTMAGPLGGHPATGRTGESRFLSLFRIDDGRIAELWVEWDNLSLLAQLGVPPPVDGVALLARYQSAHRGGDVVSLLKLHTGDAMFTVEGRPPVSGWESLRDLFEWDAALGSELDFDAVTTHGDLITIDAAVERNRLFRELGVEAVRYRPGLRLKLRGSLIQGVYVPGFDEASQAAVDAAFRPVIAWLARQEPDTLGQLMPGGHFRYDAASAARWLEVVAAWRKTPEGRDQGNRAQP